ncbi:putative secreted protein [Corynebacterium ulcerans BR-AD22]|nr:putative secreted protein [Corynebacterium ulcerans BR-AD22]
MRFWAKRFVLAGAFAAVVVADACPAFFGEGRPGQAHTINCPCRKAAGSA